MEILRKKKKQKQKEMLEMNNAVKEMKNAFGGLMSKRGHVNKESLSWRYINRYLKTPKNREQRKKEQNACGLWVNYQRCNVHTMGIPERKGEKGTEGIFGIIMTKNYPKLMSDTKSQIQEAQRTPDRIKEKQK